VVPGSEAGFLAPLEVRKIPGVGKAAEKSLHTYGIRRVGDMARLDEDFLRRKFGQWGLAMAGKSRGLDAGGWFDSEVGVEEAPKSISHEHTFGEDSGDASQMEATLAHLAEKVGRRLREHGLHARTVQLKLRTSDFATITRAQSLDTATQLDIDLIEVSRKLFRENWNPLTKVRLLGVHTSGFESEEPQRGLLDGERNDRWKHALEAADKLRDKFGESAVSVGTSLKGRFKERIQDNPAELRKPEGR
jgi:DNA polymerase-4